MSRRIEVELTSRRDDGTWTWRAAGAREPKGLVDAALLPAESKVGDNLRVEIEQFIDGIGILAVLPARSSRTEPQRLELLGPATPERLVTTTVSPRGRRDDRDRPRRPRDDAGGDRRDGRRDGPRRPDSRPDGEGRPRRAGDGGDGRERRGRPAFERRPPLEPKPRPKRIRPGRTHRRELIAELPEEQRPIAEELSKGGIPGVRAALEAQNAQAKEAGQPEINPEPLLALAEELWPRMRTAEWHDRAEAAWKEVDELDLRDLRSVVVAADSGARDDDTRALAAQLREALTRRVDEEHLKWLTELAELVADSRIVAALRRSSRPPKAGAPLPSDLARLLIDRTAEALNAEAGADRWSVLLDALSFSPVRSSVTPAAVPEHPGEEMVAAVRRSAARLPHIAALFGIEAPPAAPPGRSGGGRRAGGRSGARPERAGGGRGERPARAGSAGTGGGGSTDARPIPPPPDLGADQAAAAADAPADAESVAATADAPADASQAAAPVDAPTDEATAGETAASVETAAAPAEPGDDTAADDTAAASESAADETAADEAAANAQAVAADDEAAAPAGAAVAPGGDAVGPSDAGAADNVPTPPVGTAPPVDDDLAGAASADDPPVADVPASVPEDAVPEDAVPEDAGPDAGATASEPAERESLAVSAGGTRSSDGGDPVDADDAGR